MQQKGVPILYILLLISFTAFAACRKSSAERSVPPVVTDTTPPSRPVHMPYDSSGYSYLALGDSYTIGESVQEYERYPAQAVADYNNNNKRQITRLKYIARTGWTTGNLLNALYSDNSKDTFDLVTLLIGVNDQYQQFDTGSYRDKFTTVLKKSIQFAGNNRQHVVVLSVPDYGVTPFASQSNPQQISAQIDLFNNINHEIANQFGITYIDVTTSSREALKDPSLIAFDGLHFSGKMYAKWANMLEEKMREILK